MPMLTRALGRIDIPDPDGSTVTTYQINAEFQQGVLSLADELDLDEIQAGCLFWEGKEHAEVTGRPIASECVVRFHQQRAYLLHSIRILLGLQLKEDLDDHIRQTLDGYVQALLDTRQGQSKKYTTRCIDAMGGIRMWLQRLAAKSNTASVLGADNAVLDNEVLEYQRVNLIEQHECLGIILELLVKNKEIYMPDFESLLEVLRKSERYDNLLGKLPFLCRFGPDQADVRMDSASFSRLWGICCTFCLPRAQPVI